MHRVHDRELFGLQMRDIEIDEASQRLTFQLADHGDPDFDAIAAEARLRSAAAASGPDAVWDVVTADEPRRRLAAVIPAPPLGWTAVRVAEMTPAAPAAHAAPASETERHGIRQGERVLDNGLVQVRVDDDGTLTVTADGITLRGVGRLVDGGDPGDSYNYAPPAHDVLVSEPTQVSVTALGSEGPVVGALRVDRRYELPVTSDLAGRSDATESTAVAMHVELRAGEPFVRLRLDWQNVTRDHRLRLHVPTARPAAVSHAQGQLAVVERGRTAEAGPVGEHPLPTFPAERFVDAGGVAVLLGRTVEYEVVDSVDPVNTSGDGTEIAVTVLRSIGYLSRNVHPYRSEPAGPQLPTPDAQALGPCHLSLAVMPHQGSWAAAEVAEATEAFLHPVVVARGAGPADGPLPSVEGLTSRGRRRRARVAATPDRCRHGRRGAGRQHVRPAHDRGARVRRGAGPRGRRRRRARHGRQPARRGRRPRPGSAAPVGDRCSAGRHRSPPPSLTTEQPVPQGNQSPKAIERAIRPGPTDCSFDCQEGVAVSRRGRGRPGRRPRASTDRTTRHADAVTEDPPARPARSREEQPLGVEGDDLGHRRGRRGARRPTR